jgi:hypothetical protein
MPKKKTTKSVPAAEAASKPRKETKGIALVPGFENKAGRYELTRVEDDQAYYSFTNLQGRTVDAAMSVTVWRRMQQKADGTFQKTA